MFTLPMAYLASRRKGKVRPNNLMPFRPSLLNIKTYAEHRDCSKIVSEHPWIVNIKMYENPMLTDTLVNADYSRLTIELSSDIMQSDLDIQRDIFIRAVCSFLSQRVFNDIDGKPYELLVQRYSKRSAHKTNNYKKFN